MIKKLGILNTTKCININKSVAIDIIDSPVLNYYFM